MTQGWDDFSAVELRAIAEALATGRLGTRPSGLSLEAYCSPASASWVANVLTSMPADPAMLATLLHALASERERVATANRSVELVWTGPDIPNDSGRDTGAVVRELFATAKTSILVVGYAIHGGRDLFRILADRHDHEPALRVDLVVDVRREAGDTSLSSEIVPRFARDFRDRQWPGRRLPNVYYDPRSLAEDPVRRSAMHAKCIVIDATTAFVTSANFTTAAQTKNVEVGVLIQNPSVASDAEGRFRYLVDSGSFRRVNFVDVPRSDPPCQA